jgi:hypothetical protein
MGPMSTSTSWKHWVTVFVVTLALFVLWATEVFWTATVVMCGMIVFPLCVYVRWFALRKERNE